MKLTTAEKARLKPQVQEKPEHGKAYAPYLKRAIANGIGKATFDYRVYVCHWDKERACTEPVGESVGLTKAEQKKRGKS